MPTYVIGVDVGSGSVRAGLFNLQGKMLGLGVHAIEIRRPEANYVEQSSDNIWKQTCSAVKTAVKQSGVNPSDILGIAFDATCSLVALGNGGKPVSIAKDHNPHWNIIMWMDHRAHGEAEEINAQPNEVLRYVGGKISVEMEIPKIMWLKRNLPKQYHQVTKFFDLADFLQYKACGSELRSSCTVTCKWTYLAHEKTWNKDFFHSCGLDELLDGRIGASIGTPGDEAGFLGKEAAKAMGLTQKCQCRVGMIDAHAGGIGAAGPRSEGTLTIIAGTSACHMLNTKDPLFVPGVWGPYYSAMIEGLWLNEGGQSAAGALIDHTIQNHGYYSQIKKEAKISGESVHSLLGKEIALLRQKEACLNADLHLLGYHHGNRSPRADASLKGMASGLTLDINKKNLALAYLSAIQSVCYGTRHIIEECTKAGHRINRLVVCGGATKNPLWLRELADITGMSIETPRESEAVLLGSAILAASGLLGGVLKAAEAMCGEGAAVKPSPETKKFHDKKYRVFLEMYSDQMKYRHMMTSSL